MAQPGFHGDFLKTPEGFQGLAVSIPILHRFVTSGGRDFAFLVIVSRKGSDPMSVPSAGLLAVDHFPNPYGGILGSGQQNAESAANLGR